LFTIYRHQNIYQNLILRILEAAFKHGTEELILLVLLKGNLLSPLVVAYKDIYQNGTLMNKFHVDSFMLSLKRIISYINYIEDVKDLLILFN
jgi:hypothetical protein